jgi:hypothetical protein
MVDNGFASSSTLRLDVSCSPLSALWRVVGALPAEEAQFLARDIELLAAATISEKSTSRAPRLVGYFRVEWAIPHAQPDTLHEVGTRRLVRHGPSVPRQHYARSLHGRMMP